MQRARARPFGFPRTLGSTLRATGEPSDFTLVELDEDPPDGSLFFGWTTADVTQNDGTILYRLHHPNGRPQFYTEEQITATPSRLNASMRLRDPSSTRRTSSAAPVEEARDLFSISGASRSSGNWAGPAGTTRTTIALSS